MFLFYFYWNEFMIIEGKKHLNQQNIWMFYFSRINLSFSCTFPGKISIFKAKLKIKHFLSTPLKFKHFSRSVRTLLHMHHIWDVITYEHLGCYYLCTFGMLLHMHHIWDVITYEHFGCYYLWTFGMLLHMHHIWDVITYEHLGCYYLWTFGMLLLMYIWDVITYAHLGCYYLCTS